MCLLGDVSFPFCTNLFLPAGKTISVRTFSPLFALSPTTCDKAWRTASYDPFKIIIEN